MARTYRHRPPSYVDVDGSGGSERERSKHYDRYRSEQIMLRERNRRVRHDKGYQGDWDSYVAEAGHRLW
jgi:hypothetical protein